MDLRRPEPADLQGADHRRSTPCASIGCKHNFIEIHSPKIMGAPSESGAELFEMKYFERKAYLAQSPQFYKQMAMAAGFERVFEIGPVFRADPSFTSRHMTEFTGVDMEMSWVDTHEDVMAFKERWLQYTLQKVKEHTRRGDQGAAGLRPGRPGGALPAHHHEGCCGDSQGARATSCRRRRRAISTRPASASWASMSRKNTTTISSSSPTGRSACARSTTCAIPMRPPSPAAST